MSQDSITFAVWAPDEATFRQSWINAGILADEPGYVFTSEYPGIEVTATQGWSGIIGEIVGWHCNARVTGPLVAEMTYGLDQYDESGALRSVFDRTWAVQIFSLIEQEADPATGFPAGYRNTTGVTYADVRDITTPSNVRQ